MSLASPTVVDHLSSLVPGRWLGLSSALFMFLACGLHSGPGSGMRPAWLCIHMPRAEARTQARYFGAQMGPEQALDAAIHALAHDARDVESLARLARDSGIDVREPGDAGPVHLYLMTRGQRAPRGETTGRAWLFRATWPGFSDHVFWVVVPRETAAPGSIGVYTYGVN